jgi:DNA-binding Lrp family transcriptional regulator
MQYKQIAEQLNETNIRIFSAMWRYGPRNLLEVSRRTRIPFTSVYHRISRIESKSEEVVFLIPSVSGAGMIRVTLLVAASPGCENEVTHALKAPNLWRSIAFCEGTFTHISVQLIPLKLVKEFRSYIQQLVDSGLITNFNIIYTSDYVPNFPDFDYYDPTESQWKFDWEGWLASLAEKKDGITFDDPESYTSAVDKKDLVIIRELEIDGRRSFTDIAETMGMTAQSVKHHYDKLVASGIAKYFQFRVLPYPVEVSAYHEVMLEFNSKEDLSKFISIVPRLFFVMGVAKVLRRNAVMVETWILESQLQKMFSFFSQMVRAGLLKSYSAVRMYFRSKEDQTISDELFDDERGWIVDFEKCKSDLLRMEKARISS